MKNFVNRLIYLRKEKGLNHVDIANQICLNAETYKNYERGLCYPKLVTLLELTEFYNVSLDYLAGLTDDRGEYRTMDVEQLPKRIIELRRQSGMSQSAIAKQINVTKSGYKYYEMGKSIPPLPRLIALADLFGVSLDYLVGFNEMNI